MAKLRGPLFSFSASGAIGKVLVYFGWKGLNVARSYVIPTNPKSDDQIAQRNRLTAAVGLIHDAQALSAEPLDRDDQIAYALYGSIFPTPRTWFNTMVKNIVDCLIAIALTFVLCNGEIDTSTPLQLTFTGLLYHPEDTDGKLYWGLSKSNMPNSVAANATAGAISAVATPTVKGTKYYLQWRADPAGKAKYPHSGIYTAVST